MDRQQLLDEISQASRQNQITKEEILNAYEQGIDPQQKAIEEKKKYRNLAANALQYIGGSVVFIGIIILVFENWDSLNSFTKILATLGAAVAAYILAVVFQRRPEKSPLPIIFHFLAIVLLPIGMVVSFNIWGFNFSSDSQFLLYEACLLALYITFFYGSKKYFYSVPIVLTFTTAFFTLSSLIANDYSSGNFIAYRFLAVGICYILLGYFYAAQQYKRQYAAWNALGSLIILASTLFLGGYRPTSIINIIWEIVYPLIIFAGVYYSVQMKSTRQLVFCAIFLIFWIFKITGEYFAQSLSWPLAIVIAGLLVIAVGYISAYLNRKYIKVA